ncbi:MAG: sulfatase [Anaerolineales bacterium]|nr:sulfatase [Anaerolineales bacterium]
MIEHINRRDFLKLASTAAGAAALSACQGRLHPPAIHIQDRLPNILFILTDDMDTHSLAYMPRVREHLEDQGVYMTNYFVNLPLCCPSRATNLTGQYAHNSSILTNSGPLGGYRTFYSAGFEKRTIAVDLQRSGYRTALIGKYLNGYPSDVVKQTYAPPGWNYWCSPVGGDPYFNLRYKLNEQGEIVHYKSEPEDYLTDVLAGRAAQFIKGSLKRGQPFFAYLATYAPHGPITPAVRHSGMFRGERVPRTPSFNETDVSDKPQYVSSLTHLTPEEEKSIDEQFNGRLQMLQAVDEMVEDLIQNLQAAGQLENTYIFFTSDNGFHMGHHRLRPGKATPYDEDIRVPLLARGPGVPAGQKRSALVGNVDLAPTFASIAGLERSKYHDGRSLLPALSEEIPPSQWRQAYLIEHYISKSEAFDDYDTEDLPDKESLLEPEYSHNSEAYRPAFKGLRTEDHLYVEYITGEKELYNLVDDPYQIENLAAAIEPQSLEQFSRWLERVGSAKGKGCLQAEQIPTKILEPGQ